jgi:hypothetical protein
MFLHAYQTVVEIKQYKTPSVCEIIYDFVLVPCNLPFVSPNAAVRFFMYPTPAARGIKLEVERGPQVPNFCRLLL